MYCRWSYKMSNISHEGKKELATRETMH
jgi:hypothetical protein